MGILVPSSLSDVGAAGSGVLTALVEALLTLLGGGRLPLSWTLV